MVNEQKLDALLQNTGDLCLKRRARIMVQEIDPQKKDKILDVGCGDGFYLFILSQLGKYNLIGIDSQAPSIAAAKKFIRDKSVKLVVGDINAYGFSPESFNKIICSEVVEHLSNDVTGLKSMYRLLKKGGHIYITVPHLNYPFFWDPLNWILQHIFGTHVKSGFWAGIWNMHDRLYTMAKITDAVKIAGFKIEKKKYITHYCVPFNHTMVYVGFRLRTSPKLSASVKNSMSKFNPGKKTWFSYVLSFINWLDQRNDREIRANESSVCLFVKARK